MRYIITQSQLHKIVYKYLDSMFAGVEAKKEVNIHNENAYRISLTAPKTNDEITYYFYGTGEYDDWRAGGEGTKHFGIGHLHINPDIVDALRVMVRARETKVVDIISDWFSEKYQVDIDEVALYPKRKKPPVY